MLICDQVIKKDLSEVLISVIKSEFIFFKIEREVFGINTVALEEKLFCEAPKALDAVDMAGAVGEVFLVIDREVLSEALKITVAGEFVGVKDGTLDGVGLDFAHEGFFGAVGHDHRADPAVAFQQPEHRHFTCRTASTPSLAMAAKVGLIDFDLAKQLATLRLGQIRENLAVSPERCIGRRIGHSDVFGRMVCTGLEHKRPQQRPLPLLLRIAPLPPTSRTLPLAA